MSLGDSGIQGATVSGTNIKLGTYSAEFLGK
jgi:hypothetical protein